MKILQKNKLIFILIIIALGLGIMWAFSQGIIKIQQIQQIQQMFSKWDSAKMPTQQAQRQLNPAENTAIPVKIIKIKRQDFKDTLNCLGTIKGFREIELRFATSGTIDKFNFEQGEPVKKDVLIAILDQREARIKLEYAQLEYQRDKKIFQLGGISKNKLRQSELEVEAAKLELEKTEIYAPCNGLMGPREKEEGEYISPNDKVGTFLDIRDVFCEVGIIEKDIKKIVHGQRVDVLVDAYPDRVFSGFIDSISPMMEGRARTQTVKIKLDNLEGLLKPGMFARANISIYEKKNTFVIPTTAVKNTPEGYFIYVLRDLTKAGSKIKTIEERGVSLGYLGYESVQINRGLNEGEIIVLETPQAKEKLKDKARVEIIEDLRE